MSALLALAVVLGSVGGPLLLSWLNARQRARELIVAAGLRREEKREDWARQDEVAAKVEAVQVTLADSTGATNDKLDQIHTLVNSNMTAAMQERLDAREDQLTLMKEVSALHEAAGRPPTPEAEAAIHAMETTVATLRADLAERNAAAEQAQ